MESEEPKLPAVRSIAWLGLIAAQGVIGKCLLQQREKLPRERSAAKPPFPSIEFDLSTVRAHQDFD